MYSRISLNERERERVVARYRIAFLVAIILAFLVLFNVQNNVLAKDNVSSQDTNCGSLPSINWSTPNPNSLVSGKLFTNPISSEQASTASKYPQLSATSEGQVAMYRLYNPYSGEHFYTSDKAERDRIIKLGWRNEDIAWVAPKKSNTPVYRLYNPYCEGGDHHYTISKKEYDDLKKSGWLQEGVCWYSVDYDSVYKTPVYRQYNPYEFSCNHNYTIDTKERDTLIKAGWQDEGVAYYGLDFTKMEEMNSSLFTVNTSEKTYNGKAQTQTITSSKLKENEDYIVEYSNNINVGTATITITGTNGYYGEMKYYFKIIQKEITQVKWSATQFTYTGKPQAPTASAVGLCESDVANITVVASEDHTKSGIYTATATAISNKNYKLATGLKTSFQIGMKIDFDDENSVTIDTGDEVYTEKEITKELTLAGLEEGTDYSVEYKDNINVGTAKLTIKGIRNYFGEKSYDFKITARDISEAEVKLGQDLTYNGETQTQTVEKVVVKVNGTDLEVPSNSYILSDNAGKNATEGYTLSIKGIGNFTGEKTVAFRIAPLDISNAEITLGEKLTYNGEMQTQAVSSVKVGTLVLSESDYDLSDNTATNAGSANTLTVTGKGNFVGQKKQLFSIEKANPTYTVGTLKGKLNEELSTVTLPDPLSTDTSGSVAWVDKTTVMSIEGEQTYSATFTPEDASNYNAITIEIKVKVEKTLYITFIATAPGSETITMDDVLQNEVTKSLSYDDSSTETPTHTLVAGDFPTVSITSTNTDSYQFAGWSTTENDSVKYGIAQDQLVSNKTKVTEDITYYAIWLKSSGYWMGTKDAGIEYANEAYFATHDTNYIPASTIQADMKILHNSSSADRTTTLAKWQGYYDNDRRLYATYYKGEEEGSFDEISTGHNQGATSQLNKYVEFRIIEVSTNTTGHDSDNSAITFMATHLLPTLYQMNFTGTNIGGWGSSALMTAMNNGEIYNKFASDFTSEVLSVRKLYGLGNSKTITVGWFKFWLLSCSEMAGSKYTEVVKTKENSDGVQYYWCSKTGIIGFGKYDSRLMNWKTRAGKMPGGSDKTCFDWWLRTTHTGTTNAVSQAFAHVTSEYGCLGISYGKYNIADTYGGVVPAFCF